MEFTHYKGDQYHVTGVDRNGKRFKIVSSNPYYALAIHLSNGTVWQVRGGKRTRLKRVIN